MLLTYENNVVEWKKMLQFLVHFIMNKPIATLHGYF